MILIENEIIVAIMDKYEQKENGKLINGVIFPMGEVVDIEVPSEVTIQKYCYNPIQSFYINPEYKEVKTQEQINEEIQNNQAQILLTLVLGGLM